MKFFAPQKFCKLLQTLTSCGSLDKLLKLIFAILFLGLLCSCSHNITQTRRDGAPAFNVNVDNIPNAVPKYIPQSKYGNPESYLVKGKRYFTLASAKNFKQKGIASWYGTRFHDRLTSSGEKYNMLAMTAAHKTLPLPTFVRVTNLLNRKSVIVKVNDRGPFKKGRIIDLSYAAAKKLDMIKHGTAPVEIIALPPFNTPSPDRYSLPYVVQYGAFKSQDKAKTFKETLAERTRTHDIYIDYNNAFYVVRSGPYKTAKLANKMAQEAKWLGYDGAYIFQSVDDN